MHLVAAAWFALQSPAPLDLPARVADRLFSGAQPHQYTITVKQGDVLLGGVEQRGIDLVAAIRASDGRTLFEIDSPNGTDGLEPIAWIAPADGTYVLEIRKFEQAGDGNYDLKLERRSPARSGDRDVARALTRYQAAYQERDEALRLQNAGQFERSIRLYRSARATAIEVLRTRQRSLGADAIELVPVLQLLGLIDDEIGDYRSGVRHFDRALALLEARYGVGHAATLTTRSDLGFLRFAAGDYDGAAALFQSVIRARTETDNPSGEANAQMGLGETLMHAGKLDAAETAARRAVSIRESTGGLENANAVAPMVLLGTVLVRRGQLDEGEALCRRIEQRLKAVTVNARWRGLATACLGEVALSRRDARSAVLLAESTVRTMAAAYGPDGPPTAEAMLFESKALAAAGRPTEARATLERARKILTRRLGREHPKLKAER